VFAALVVATVGAFFVTTRLKRSTPVIEQLTFRRSFSPNGDGRFDVALFAFRLRRTDEVTVAIVTRDGDEVRTLARDVLLSGGGHRHRFHWDGRTDSGRVAEDGEYHMQVGLRRQGRTVTSGRKLFLDTRPPRPVVNYVSPDSFSPDGAGRANSVQLRFSGASRRARLLVYRTDVSPPRLVARRLVRRGATTARWDGRITGGDPAPTGNYLLAVRAQDAAGNVGPLQLPPPRGTVRGHPGVAVRYVAAARSLQPAAAGALTRFRVLTDGRRYRWSVRRLGRARVLARGSSRRETLTVRAPRGTSGVALLTVRVGSHRYTTPLAVQARRRTRVLVVLPAAAWQARNPLEADGDGYADLLPVERQVGSRRPFAGSGMPPGFLPDQAAVLQFLRSQRYRYDLTTDLGLAQDPGVLDQYRGMLFVGAPRFAPGQVVEALRPYLRSGGRVAWLGTGAFQWTVSARGEVLALGTRLRPGPFGERVRRRVPAGPLVVLGDRISFFRGTGGGLGPFGPQEESLRLPVRARVLASAGSEADRPAIVVYRSAGGVVARVGVDRFGRALATSPDAGRIMRRLWALLSR
jgi:FlgD Ig-like domain